MYFCAVDSNETIEVLLVALIGCKKVVNHAIFRKIHHYTLSYALYTPSY